MMNQSTTLQIKNWDELSNDEKLDRLTAVLTRAGADQEFRDRCLLSAASAREAVGEEGAIKFSPDFEVEFLSKEEQLKKLVLAVPDYIPAGPSGPEIRQAEDFILCTYNLWRN